MEKILYWEVVERLHPTTPVDEGNKDLVLARYDLRKRAEAFEHLSRLQAQLIRNLKSEPGYPYTYTTYFVRKGLLALK